MNKLFYPALFHMAEEGGFWITFPDIPECLTQGDDMEDAYNMSIDALGLCITDMIKNKVALPAPSEPAAIKTERGSFLVVVEFDLNAYRKRHNSKAVKKTVSIPEWLNEEAQEIGINFSQTLQEALISKVQQVKRY